MDEDLQTELQAIREQLARIAEVLEEGIVVRQRD